MRRILIIVVALVAALMPAAAMAQDGRDSGGFVMRVSGDFHLTSGEQLNNLWVIDGNAVIDGTVQNTLVVVNGDATVNGRVDGHVTMVRGTLTLASGSTVDNVSLVRGHINEESGSVRTGDLSRTSLVFLSGFGIVLAALIVVGTTLALLAAGALFAGIGGKQLMETVELLGTKPGQTIGFGFIVAIGLPVLAAFSITTIIGIPAGIAMLLLVAPALMFMGYIVAGAWLGTLILRRPERVKAHPYAETLLGLFVLQAGLLIPGLGATAFVLLGLWGTGGLAYHAWHSMRSGGAVTAAGTPTPPSPAAPAGGMQPT